MKSSRWPSVPIRRLGTVVGGGTPTVDPAYWEGDIPFVTPPDLRPVVGGVVHGTQRTLTAEGASAGSSIVPPNSVLVSIRAPIGYVARTAEPAAFNQGCRAIVPTDQTSASYLTYALIAAGDEMDSLGRGTTFMELSATQMAALELPSPPLGEQRAIADYLDRETARIDTLIEEQQLLIEMLRGRRKAVVERAVFCGLDDAPSTGNPEPWLPDTPAHWPVVQLGFLSDTLAGYAFSSDGFSAHEDHVRLLRGVNVKPGVVDWSDVVYWDTQTQPVPVEYSLSPGDLVFGMDRPFVGAGVRVAPVADDDLPALLLQRVMRIRSKAVADSSYLRYAVATDAFLDYLEPLFTGVSVPHVSEWQVASSRCPAHRRTSRSGSQSTWICRLPRSMN